MPLVSALQKNTEPVQKITIVPVPWEPWAIRCRRPRRRNIWRPRDELIAKITTYMAGRAAEEIVFESYTSGAANDIENATNIARNRYPVRHVRQVRHDGPGFGGEPVSGRQSGSYCGEKTASEIDDEVLSIISGCYDEAKRLLSENREILDKISDYLYEHETITGKEFMKIFRELKGIRSRRLRRRASGFRGMWHRRSDGHSGGPTARSGQAEPQAAPVQPEPAQDRQPTTQTESQPTEVE